MDNYFVNGGVTKNRFLGENNEKSFFVISIRNMQNFMSDTLGPWAELKYQFSSKSDQ